MEPWPWIVGIEEKGGPSSHIEITSSITGESPAERLTRKGHLKWSGPWRRAAPSALAAPLDPAARNNASAKGEAF
jgi:hypothetical protein